MTIDLPKLTPSANTRGAKTSATGSGKRPPPAAATAQSTHESFSGFPVSSVDGEVSFAWWQITRASLIAFP